jgi:hypothetical protein
LFASLNTLISEEKHIKKVMAHGFPNFSKYGQVITDKLYIRLQALELCLEVLQRFLFPVDFREVFFSIIKVDLLF